MTDTSPNPTVLPAFAERHIGPDDTQVAEMLAVIGRSSLDDLTSVAVPDAIRATSSMGIVPADFKRTIYQGNNLTC